MLLVEQMQFRKLKMTKLYSIVLLTFLCVSSYASASVTKVAEGVYAGQGTASSGEIVYFGMELVDSSNIVGWERYVTHAKFMTADSSGKILVYSMRSEPGLRSPYSEGIKEDSGFTEEEYTSYMDNLYNKGFYKPEKYAGLRGVPSGAAGFYIEDDGNYYVVYASKKPVTGKFNFPKTEEFIRLKDFNRIYDDILMSVRSSDSPGTDSYSNRGILRNPKSFIDGGYAGLALKLHGFSAAVAKQIFKDKKFMVVSPTEVMQKILDKALKPEDVKKTEGTMGETNNHINIDALAKFYN